MENYENFDWGTKDDFFVKVIGKEIFIERIYEKFFSVDSGDVVMDVGASSGAFTYSILNKNPKHVFCFEPSTNLFRTLVKNTLVGPVTCINKGISSNNGVTDNLIVFLNDNTKTYSVTFKQVIDDYSLKQIDFLKTDCEGGEYDIFNQDNLVYIKNNVRKIAGEWHLGSPEFKTKFRNFRDLYLKEFKNYEILSVDGIDIKWNLWNDKFIEYYNEILVYIDNR